MNHFELLRKYLNSVQEAASEALFSLGEIEKKNKEHATNLASLTKLASAIIAQDDKPAAPRKRRTKAEIEAEKVAKEGAKA